MLRSQRDEAGHTQAIGDPTETALVMAAAEAGIDKDDLEKAFPHGFTAASRFADCGGGQPVGLDCGRGG